MLGTIFRESGRHQFLGVHLFFGCTQHQGTATSLTVNSLEVKQPVYIAGYRPFLSIYAITGECSQKIIGLTSSTKAVSGSLSEIKVLVQMYLATKPDPIIPVLWATHPAPMPAVTIMMPTIQRLTFTQRRMFSSIHNALQNSYVPAQQIWQPL